MPLFFFGFSVFYFFGVFRGFVVWGLWGPRPGALGQQEEGLGRAGLPREGQGRRPVAELVDPQGGHEGPGDVRGKGIGQLEAVGHLLHPGGHRDSLHLVRRGHRHVVILAGLHGEEGHGEGGKVPEVPQEIIGASQARSHGSGPVGYGSVGRRGRL